MIQLPFEFPADIDLIVDEKDLDRLDKLAAKREKKLEDLHKKLEKQGGIFGKQGDKPTLPDINALDREGKDAIQKTVKDAIFGGKTSNLPKGFTEEEKKQKRNKLLEILGSDLGVSKANQAFSMLSDPLSFLTRFVPQLAAVMITTELIKSIAAELTKRGGLLSTFFEDLLNTRLDAFRDRLTQAEIRAGFTQFINVQRSGLTNPRDAYNTFNLFNQNKQQLEKDFSIRNTGGFE